jgi:plastocyanin
MKIKLVKGCATAAAMLLGSAIAWAGGVVTVDQRGLAFSVGSLTLKKGDIVNFTNNDSTSHNILVVGEGVRLNSGLQAPGVTFKAPFLKSGSYQVICGIHPRMKIAVAVK